MKHLIISLFLSCFVQLLTAQNYLDILNITGRYTTPAPYDSVLTGNAQETGTTIGLTVPIPISKKTIFYSSLNYFYFHVDNKPETGKNIANPINLHAYILRTGIIQRLGNGKSLQLLIAPRFMSDYENIGTKNLQLGGLAAYEKIYSDNLTLGFGVNYNYEEFGHYIVPIVNLKWYVFEKVSITGVLPIYSKINYHFSKKLTAGICHFGLTTTFPLGDENYDNDYIERQSIDLALFSRYNLVSNFFLEARLGKTIGRCYRQYHSDDKIDFALPLATFGDDRVPINTEFEDSYFAEIRIIYSIPIPED